MDKCEILECQNEFEASYDKTLFINTKLKCLEDRMTDNTELEKQSYGKMKVIPKMRKVNFIF